MISSKTVLFKGSLEKENILLLQKRLRELSYYLYPIDGSYGVYTELAVKSFQAKNKLVVDGVAGPITLKALGLIKSTSNAPVFNSDKTEFLKQMASAIGGKFNTLTECYNLIRKNETYKFGLGDVYDQKRAVENLQKGIGNNCVDYAQLLTAVASDLNKVANKGYRTNYVRTYCSKDKVGHVYISVRGGEFLDWTNIDGAAGASPGSKYPIGRAWCQDYPDKIFNQNYLIVDDGV